MKTIYLAAGTEHVQFDELAHLIADALWPDVGLNDNRMTYGCACLNLDGELARAVKFGALAVKDPLTLGPHTFPMGNALLSALVTVDDLREFVADRGVAVVMEAPANSPATPAPVADSEWKVQARTRALEIIKESRKRDLYPSQESLGDQVASEFRRAGTVGADGKPLSGATIKRHALGGISSATNKQLSTTIRRGK